MKRVSTTRMVVWGGMLLAIVAAYSYRAYITGSPPAGRAQLNASRYAGTGVLSRIDISDMPEEVPVRVRGVQVHPESASAAVLLVDEDETVYLPIFVGPFEASAISRSMEGLIPPRPLTHELLSDVIDRFGGQVVKVVILSLERGTFKASLVLENADGDNFSIDARPSDSIAIALMKGADIFVAASVMEEAAYRIEDEDELPDIPSEPERRTPPRAPDAELI